MTLSTGSQDFDIKQNNETIRERERVREGDLIDNRLLTLDQYYRIKSTEKRGQ